MGDLPTRVALVYDRVNKWGGAEQVLLSLHRLFPSAPLYTSVFDERGAAWAKVFPAVIPTFLQKLRFFRSRHELLPWITPLAFETLSFDEFDAVISVTSADAKGIVTRPETFHLCYCLTPTRYLWSHHDQYVNELNPAARLISRPVFSYLKYWDRIASSRPDAYISISKAVQTRVKQFYGRSSQVVYPPVDTAVHTLPTPPPSIKDFFLYVGRLIPYKRPDVVVNVFNQINLPLAVVGTGHMEKKLRRKSGSNIHMAGFLSVSQLTSFYQNCRALVFFHEEDFGIVPLEAHSAGKPVIALNRGGAAETVIHNVTGILLDNDSPSTLARAVAEFDPSLFDPQVIKTHAANFSTQKFASEFVRIFKQEWKKYKNIYTV